jgi:predicted DNA-binding transcriptional regulator YafY
LRFSASVAEEARFFIFHSSQSLQPEPDGSLLLSFRAGGLRELCWFLFSWGTDVTIEAPVRLRRMFDRMIGDLAAR